MSRLARLTRTAAFRITCAYLAVFTSSIVVIGAIAYFGASTVWESDIEDAVETEWQLLMKQFGARGLDGLAGAISDRAGDMEETGFIYLLQSPEGGAIAGQLGATSVIEGWHEIVPSWVDEDEPFIANGTVLPDGSYFLVGRDAYYLHEMLDFIEEGFGWTFAFALPLALFGGLFVSSITLRRVESINRATGEIRGGDLTKRIPVDGTNDEFDRLAGSINAMLDGIEDLTDGLRQVSQDIAHDLRTPLTRVRQNLEQATLEKTKPERTAEILASSVEEVDRLLEAFNALLRIAQIESGTRKQGFQEFDLSQTSRQLVDDFESVAADSGKKINASIDDGVSFFGDRSLIIQMMVNLIENAICHTYSGTEILFGLRRNRDSVEAVVADNGPGIPRTAKEKVLRRFYRGDKSRQGPGSGLGLSLVTAVAKLHGIDVDLVDNRPGLKVVLSFPDLQRG